MKAKKVHLKDPEYNFPKYHFDVRLRSGSEQLTEEPVEVTCKRCLSAMRKEKDGNG